MVDTWTIVNFVHEDAVEAVPSDWIIANKCYWPSLSKEKIIAAIKNHQKPNTCWPSHDVRVFRNGTYGMYYN